MRIYARILVSIVVALAALKTSPVTAKDTAIGVTIGQDGIPILRAGGVPEVDKHKFLEKLQGEQSILLSFYDDGNEESDKAMSEFEAFAERAASRYPDLYVGKVNFKANPYMTARLLLTGIPQLRLVVKGQDGNWVAYNPEIAEGADELFEYMDNQQWYLDDPVGNRQQLYCSPFNFCGKVLAVIADKGSAIDQYIPLPRWLALIVIPALITFIGRFIIEGMYAAEDRVRGLFRARQQPAVDQSNNSQSSEKQTELSSSRIKEPVEGKKTR